MKKFLILATLVLTAGFSGCKYDDGDLWDELNGQKARLAQLEQKVESLNSDIQSIQTLVSALETQDMITNVTALSDGSGYTITFKNHSPITIKHGEKGADGSAPVISVAEDSGVYYWTIDGEFLKDGSDNKIPVTGGQGAAGQDGITPELRINSTTYEWEISTDGGSTWVSTGIVAQGQDGATGPKGDKGETGDPGDNSYFDGEPDTTTEDGFVIFNLASGGSIKIPIYKPLAIEFTNLSGAVEMIGGVEFVLEFTATATLQDIGIASALPSGWAWSSDVNAKTITIKPSLAGGEAKVLIVATTAEGVPVSYWVNLEASETKALVGNFADLNAALSTATDGDVIIVNGAIDITGQLAINKSITLTGTPDSKLSFDGTFSPILVSGAVATIDGLTFKQTDKNSGQIEHIRVTGSGSSGTIIQNCSFTGKYEDGDSKVSRAILADAGVSLTIIGNEFIDVRQPAYIQGPAVIKNNHVEGTKGWVICQDAIVDMTGNTFGTNAVDIAIINNGLTDQSNYTTDRTHELHTQNGSAHVENQVVTNLSDQYAAYNSYRKDGTTYVWVNN